MVVFYSHFLSRVPPLPVHLKCKIGPIKITKQTSWYSKDEMINSKERNVEGGLTQVESVGWFM